MKFLMSPVSLWSDWHFVASLKIIKNYRSQNPCLLYLFVVLCVSETQLFVTNWEKKKGKEVQRLLLIGSVWELETNDFCLQYCITEVSALKTAFYTKYKVNIILNNLAWIVEHWIKIYFLVQGKGKWNKWYAAKGYSPLVNTVHSCVDLDTWYIPLFNEHFQLRVCVAC